MILCIAMVHYKAFGTYNGAMMLSPSLVGTLRTFNQMDPAARSGMLPVRDGAAFAEKVLTMPPSQAHSVPTGTTRLQDSMNPSEAGVLAARRAPADARSVPEAVPEIEREVGNPMDPKTLASEAGDEIKKARFDPYAFSPPKAPGMDLG
jgi:hypothetical protein